MTLVVATAALAFPASALAGKAIIKNVDNAGGGTPTVISCVQVNLPGTVQAQTYTFPYSAATAAQVDQLIAVLGLSKYVAPLPPGSGVLTVSVIPNGSCSSSTGGGAA